MIQNRLWKPNPQAMATTKGQKVPGELAHYEYDSDTWLTPMWILDRLGPFDLDPCAAICQPNRTAATYFTKQHDGLAMDWHGRVFMNPPFSNTGPWIEKHAAHGKGISLVPASVESQIWRRCVWPRAAAIQLLHGRTRFCNPDGSTTTVRALRSIALIAWCVEDARVLDATDFAGIFLIQWRQQ